MVICESNKLKQTKFKFGNIYHIPIADSKLTVPSLHWCICFWCIPNSVNTFYSEPFSHLKVRFIKKMISNKGASGIISVKLPRVLFKGVLHLNIFFSK